MADQTTLEKGFVGGTSNMVPCTLISRLAESSAIAFGEPCKQGTDGDQAKQGIGAGDFIGIAVHESGISEFAQDTEARIMTQGVVYVKIKAGQSATIGAPPVYDSGWRTGGSTGVVLDEARYEEDGNAGDIVAVRLWGTNASSNA